MEIAPRAPSQWAADNLEVACTCPISQDIMEDPVQAADGYTYERQSIEAWIRQCGTSPTSPVTGASLCDKRLVPNQSVKTFIDALGDLEALRAALREQARRATAPAASPVPPQPHATAGRAPHLPALPPPVSPEEMARARASKFPEWYRPAATDLPTSVPGRTAVQRAQEAASKVSWSPWADGRSFESPNSRN